MSRRFWLIPICILLVAFALEMSYLAELRTMFSDSFVDRPFCGVDALAHHERAQGLLSGKYPGQDPWLFIPLYPAFLAVSYYLFGVNFYLLVLFQVIFNLVTYAVLYAIGRRLFSPQVGLLAALGLAAYAPYIYYLPCFDQALFTVPFFMLAVFFLLRFEAAPRWRWLILGSVSLTLSALSRPTVLVTLPAVGLWLFLYRTSYRRFFLQLLCFGGVAAILIAPITWHNYRTTGLFIPTSKNGGVNLFTGNNPDATGLDSLAHAQSQPAVLRHIALQPRRKSGQTTYVAEVARYIRSQPLDWLQLTATKTWLWFGAADKPLISPFFPLAIEDSRLLRWLPLEWQAMALAALLGLILVRKRRYPGHVLLWLIYGAFSAGTILFFIQLRFRLPFAPFVLLYGMALVELGRGWPRQSRRFWAGLLVLGGAYLLLPVPGLWLFILLVAGAAWLPLRAGRPWLMVWSYVILGGFWLQAQAAAGDVSQTIGHYLGPPLSGSTVLGQTFEMDCHRFNRLAIKMGTFDHQHDQPVNLFLTTDRTGREILFSAQFSGATVRDHQWRTFTFEPLPDSQGRRYFFFLTSPASTPENHLTIRGYTDTPVDQYEAGRAYAGEPGRLQPLEADVAFRATCQQSFPEQLSAGVDRMARRWPGGPAFYWVMLGLHLVLGLAGIRPPYSRPHRM